MVALQEYFGPDYLFTSRILRKDSDYYLDINDPDFSTNDLNALIKGIKRKGITVFSCCR